MRKKLILWFLSFVIFILYGYGIFFSIKKIEVQRINYKSLLSENQEMKIEIEALKSQVPYHAKFMKIVKEITLISNEMLDAREIVDISNLIVGYCAANEKIGLSPDKIFALIEIESGFNPSAKSYMAAYGLTQCIKPIFQIHLPDMGYSKFSENLAFDPVVNIEVGIREIIRLRKYWMSEGIDNWLVVLNSYFWGIRPVWRFYKNGEIENLKYGKRLMFLAKKWREKGIV